MSIFKIRISGVVFYHALHVTALSMMFFLCLLSTMLLAMSCCTRCCDPVGYRNLCGVFMNMQAVMNYTLFASCMWPLYNSEMKKK